MVCKDYTVSKADFEIWHCGSCTFRFTQRVPGQADIGPYYQSDNYISHSDTDQGIISKMYKRARNYTLGMKRKLVQAQTGKITGKLLDIGCGTGAFLHALQQAGWQVTGLEPDAGARAKAKQLYGIDAQPSQELFTLSGSFDAITLWHVMEHVHDMHDYMEQFKKLLAPGGKLIIAVPNYTSKDAVNYGAFWAAYDVPRHLWHFSPASMRTLAQAHGFSIRQTKPMWLDAFYIAMLSEQYKHGSNRLISAVWQGMGSVLKAMGDKEKCSSVIYIMEVV